MNHDRVHLFGIRHHGPGSARSLERALTKLAPDCVLIEGPPDADGVLSLASHQEMQPPVALLIYVPDQPNRAAFYPFAEFSPEWRAIQYALREQTPIRFIDLPQTFQLGDTEEEAEEEATEQAEEAIQAGPSSESGPVDSPNDDELAAIRRDPLGLLAEAAGFNDSERWWDWLVESRRSDTGEVFAAVAEAMTALRDDLPPNKDLRERRREAYMRRSLRAALKEGFERIAVVCGAWHVPALDPTRFPSISHDDELLAGLKKVKTEAAWSPWTYDRLAIGSGYGAGVVSPAWYELLWSNEPHVATRWLTRVARLMRERDLDTSSAHVIEAVRLSESLAALRQRAVPGLEELDEAALAVVCSGQDAPMRLIRRRLVIGEKLGAVPADAPMAPLQRDLAALQKRLRFPPKSEIKQHDLDLRKPMDLERSQLLHRLNLLEVPWGQTTANARGSKGTFHEAWQVRWQPEFVVKLIEGSRYGNTVEAAATGRVVQIASTAQSLGEMISLLDHALLAALPQAVDTLVATIQAITSTSSDTPQLMGALPPLARVMRYGNVRQTDATLVERIVQGIVERICIGLPGACRSLSDEAALEQFQHVIAVHAALTTLHDETLLNDWFASLRSIAEQDGVHQLLQARAVRLLHDSGRADSEEVKRWMSLALSAATARPAAAAWIEGFLSGSGMVLIHDLTLWGVLEGWVAALDHQAFIDVLPLVRRTFSTFESAERRQMGDRVKRGAKPSEAPRAASASFHHDRAARVLPLIARLLGQEASQ